MRNRSASTGRDPVTHYALRSTSLLLLALLRFLRPRVFQRHGAVEDRAARLRVGVGGEIAEALELELLARLNFPEARLQLRVGDYFEAAGVEVDAPVLAGGDVFRVRVLEQVVVEAHLGVDGFAGGDPV